MSARRQETEKKRRLIRGLYENFVQGILTNEEYFELKADYEESIRTLSGEIEALEKDMDALDSRLVRFWLGILKLSVLKSSTDRRI